MRRDEGRGESGEVRVEGRRWKVEGGKLFFISASILAGLCKNGLLTYFDGEYEFSAFYNYLFNCVYLL